ncbi:MAG: hypothetical protein RBG13Loki_4255 [Promethearchaeota archaeon CR_4]|nr:MAG: hypothetical protein RBG13Loki_4255 [Candidatus Lokiarchaeota archaeon CR_4]
MYEQKYCPQCGKISNIVDMKDVAVEYNTSLCQSGKCEECGEELYF